jgi:hypothetical protein
VRRTSARRVLSPRHDHRSKDRQINNCRIVAFRSAKVPLFRGAKGDTCFRAGPNRLSRLSGQSIQLGLGQTAERRVGRLAVEGLAGEVCGVVRPAETQVQKS